MVAAPVLRSIGQHFHPVGPLTVANKTQNPNMNLADGSLNLLNYTATNCTFRQSTAITPKFGTYCGKYTALSTASYPTVIQSYTVKELQDYTASAWLNLPAPTSVGYSIFGQLYAPDNTPMDLLGGQVISGAATSGWIRTSILLSTTAGAARMDVAFVFPNSQPSALDTFYLDGLQLEPYSTVGPYVDGDMSGYVWASTKGQSDTLKSQFPSALRMLGAGPLAGSPSGMVANALMTRPDQYPVLD
jgi:hypothetical protein